MAGKKYAEKVKGVERSKLYKLEEAIDLAKKTVYAKFDETVELHFNLGVNPKHSDQLVRGIVVLPHGTGKTKRVAVIAKGEKIKEAETSGADYVGSEELIDKISKGWLEFDTLIATPDMMKDLSKLGKLLGPKGLMPNPKTGTVTMDITRAVKEVKAGRIEFKVDSYGIAHCVIGKISFSKEKLLENAKTLIETIIRAKPPAAKGQYLQSITLSTTMGPGIKIDPAQKFIQYE